MERRVVADQQDRRRFLFDGAQNRRKVGDRCLVDRVVVTDFGLGVKRSGNAFERATSRWFGPALEMFLSFRVVRITVGVMLHRQLAISLFDLFV